MLQIKRISLFCFLFMININIFYGQTFNNLYFSETNNNYLKSIIKTDSFYYIPGIQAGVYSVWYQGSVQYRSLILKMDHSGNLLDTIYLDTIGYNRIIGNIIPNDSLFFIYFITNPQDGKGKVSIGKYDHSFNELEYNILDTLPPNLSLPAVFGYSIFDSTLYLNGMYYNKNGSYINKPFLASVNINTLQFDLFEVLNEDLSTSKFMIDKKNDRYIFFDIYGYIYSYDSTFNNPQIDSLYYNYSSMSSYPLEDYFSILPYNDSLLIINAVSNRFYNQCVWSGMALTITDSNFIQKETYFFNIDSSYRVKSSLLNGLTESSDKGYFQAGIIKNLYSFSSKGIYISKVDSNFNLIWERKLMEDTFPTVTDILGTKDGGVLLLYNYLDTTLGQYKRSSKLIKIGANGEITNIAEFKYPITQAMLKLYPNPTSENLHINILGQQIGELNLKILDLQGRILLNKVINHPNENLDVSFLPSGTYILTATNSNGLSLSEKFVKY